MGDEITSDPLSIHETETKILRGIQQPKNLTVLCPFFGFRNIYEQFILHFALAAASSTSLLENGLPTHPAFFDKVEYIVFYKFVLIFLLAFSVSLPKHVLPFSVDTGAGGGLIGAERF